MKYTCLYCFVVIQVEFSKLTTVCAVKTQSRESGYNQWVTEFSIQTSTDCTSFTTLEENGQPKVRVKSHSSSLANISLSNGYYMHTEFVFQDILRAL